MMNYPRRVAPPLQHEVPHPDVMLIDAERSTRNLTAQLVRYNFLEPADHPYIFDENYRVELSLTPRPENSRICYEDSWGSDHFERVGNIFVVPPRRQFRGKSDGLGKMRVLLCQIKPEALHEWLDGELTWTDQRLSACADVQNSNIRHLLFRLADEVKYPGFAGETLIDLLTGQLSIELSRYCTAIPEAPTKGGLSPWRLRLIDERIQDDSKAPTLTELADLCQLSVRQLARGFKISRGCSIGVYVANHRIECAKNMLAGGKQSIKSIAYSLGFASPGSFCYAFRRETGLTPREFQKRLLC